MLRILLFLGTNIAIVALLSVTSYIFGINPYSNEYGSLLVFAFIVGMSGSVISLFLSKSMAKASMGVHLFDEQSAPDEKLRFVYKSVRELAMRSRIKMPEVGVFEGAPNAFATGWNKNDALVAVSTGLLQSMNNDEVEAVLAHEVGHVANGDMVTLSLIQGVVNTFVIFFARILGSIVDKAIFKNERGNGIGYYTVVFVFEIIFGAIASMIVMWFSRYREYRADEYSASLSGKESMIAALKRLQNIKNEPLPNSMSAFGISGKIGSLFSSHPPLEKRIENLRNL